MQFLIVFLLIVSSFGLDHNVEEPTESEKPTRNGRILNFFSVVRFPNNACSGGNSLNGTCYSSEECSSKGGSNSGSCAGGYGVCCTFQLGCGQTTSENCTYFQSNGQEVGQCRLKVCQCSDNICQLRLDFQSFVLNGPSTSTTSVAKHGGKEFNENTQCVIDQFSVTAPGNNAPPVICGTNSGEHMYVDSSDTCNDLGFHIGTDTTATVSTRSWTIKITQYDCNYDNLAPDGCTQYFYGTTTDIVKTYNFDGGHHLASQDQNICVRRERNYCEICWSPTATTGDFEVSGNTAPATAFLKGFCCSYGSALTKTATGYDCAVIPNPLKTDGTTLALGAYGFCGGNISTTNGGAAKTVCSKSYPFNIRFLSDLYETDTEKALAQNGFKLGYILKSC